MDEVVDVVDVVEISPTATSKNKQSNEQALVPGTYGTMFDLNQSHQPGANANSDRVTVIIIRNLIPHIIIPYCAYNLYFNGGRFNKYSLKNEYFEWVEDVIRCTLCNVEVKSPSKMLQHTTSDRHLKGKEINLFQRSVLHIDKDTKCMSLHPDIISYRACALVAAAKANIPISALIELSSEWCDKFSGYTVGGRCGIVRVIAPTVLRIIIDDLRIFLTRGCFEEYGITFDGTPSFAEAEAIVIRFETKKWEIVEVLVCCRMFKKKMNSENLANHVVETLNQRLGLNLKHWLRAQQDRDSTNKAALDKIECNFVQATPSRNYCIVHTLSNVGK